MAQVGKTRFIEFRIADLDGNPVTNRDLTALSIFLTRDSNTCNDTVTLVNWGNDGRYYATYIPTNTGHDYLEVYDSLYDLRVIDAEDIEISDLPNVGILTQDFGGTASLSITDPDPTRFTIYVFLADDWASGRTQITYSQAATAVNADGSWAFALTVLHAIYTIVAIDAQHSETRVLATSLSV